MVLLKKEVHLHYSQFLNLLPDVILNVRLSFPSFIFCKTSNRTLVFNLFNNKHEIQS